jgi:hypothetical protein
MTSQAQQWFADFFWQKISLDNVIQLAHNRDVDGITAIFTN